jgi:hypothetical protein
MRHDQLSSVSSPIIMPRFGAPPKPPIGRVSRQVGVNVGGILEGERPADLPVQPATKTSRARGLP